MLEFQIDDRRGGLNPNKLGQLLGKNANKIVGRYQLRLAKAHRHLLFAPKSRDALCAGFDTSGDIKNIIENQAGDFAFGDQLDFVVL